MTSRPLFAVVLAAALLPPIEASAQPPPTRVRITAPEHGSLLVHGEYPPVQSSCVDPYQPVLHGRYRGIIEVARASDGSLYLVGELSFDEYVKGIAEVPRDWPMEALKAQVVAARTYALNRYENTDTGGDWDLCATTACQVYVGMKVEAGPWGDRWVRAVQETAGQVILHEGEPAVTYYSSTSPGRTFDVEDRFGGEALPYLRGDRERDDAASPLSRWEVSVPFGDLSRFLAADGLWGGGPISEVAASGGRITLDGADRVTLSKDTLRDALNDWASCLMPGRYPTTEPDGYRLPQTIPSIWYRARSEDTSLILTGRGWGHGIGMVQWGAYGKAKRGLRYDQILAAYYGGLRPSPVDLPGTIRILIAEGLTRVTVAPAGRANTEPPVRAAPPWSIAGGRRLRIRDAGEPAPALAVQGFAARRRAAVGEPLRVRLTASDDVSVRLEFVREDHVAGTTAWRPFDQGDVRFGTPVPPLEPGGYEVRAVATDGVDTIVTESRTVEIASGSTVPSPTEPVPPAPTVAQAGPRAEDDRGAGAATWIAVALLVVVIVLLLLLTARPRRGLHRA